MAGLAAAEPVEFTFAPSATLGGPTSYNPMRSPLQIKDRQWRRRGNASRPVFDPGMAPLGADEEAGGARSTKPNHQGPVEPLPLDLDRTPGPRLPPAYWFAAAALLALAGLGAALWSLG